MEQIDFETAHHNLKVQKASVNSCGGIFQSQTADTAWRERHNKKPKKVIALPVSVTSWNPTGAVN